MDQLLSPPLLVVLCAVLVTAIIDLWKFKVHNVVTLPLLVSGVIYHGVTDGGSGVVESLLGVLFGFTVLGVLYCMGGMGGGDVKLLAAIGAWLLVPLTFWLLVASALAAGIYSIIVILAFGRFAQTWVNLRIIYYRLTAVARHLGADDNVEMAVGQNDRRTRVIPFATMVAIGLLVLLGIAWYAGQVSLASPATAP